ncbi:MAG TPA: helix-turn-helix domain-containing protein [Dehalococcoidales bacterium]|nr:helix-turn-helix domain-containing protein [Dehalococcoidales bacterium]
MADRATRKKRLTAERRAQILKAAVEIFSSKGLNAATIPEIARKAGVAVGTIYIYFPSKRELFVAMMKDLIITAPLLHLIYSIKGDNIATVFPQIMQNRFDLIQSDEMAWLPSLMGEVLRDKELRDLFRERFLRPLFNQLEGVYRALLPAGKSGIAPPVAVRTIGGLILGFSMIKMVESSASPLDDLPGDKVAADVARFMLFGLTGDRNQEDSHVPERHQP